MAIFMSLLPLLFGLNLSELPVRSSEFPQAALFAGVTNLVEICPDRHYFQTKL
jgi:hypothetical protein